ncbi:MAG TPA: outer membrane protein assembly factor BamE [Nevskiaceae bacterium]|nr:outer membrane protein assembly factor BamE [Nevskiaceae bacterium]
MRQAALRLTLLTAAIALSGCAIVYRLPVRQGNTIEQSQLEKLQPGMTRQQVRYVLGTPIASSPFDTNRWDYVSYYKSPRGEISQRKVSLVFNNDKLVSMIGVNNVAAASQATSTDEQALKQEQQAAKYEIGRDQGATGRGGARVGVPTPGGP